MEKQKQSLYFPEETLREIAREANRLDRSLSWTVQQAWRLAREEIKKFPESRPRSEVARDRASASQSAPQSARPPPASAAPPPIDDLDSVEPSAQVREFLKGKFDRELPA